MKRSAVLFLLGSLVAVGAMASSTSEKWASIQGRMTAAQTTVNLLTTADSATAPGLLLATMTHAQNLDGAILNLRDVDTTALDASTLADYTQDFLDLFTIVGQLRDTATALGYSDLAAEFQTCWSDAQCIFWHQMDLDPAFTASWNTLVANAKPPQQIIDAIDLKPPQQIIDIVYAKPPQQ